MDHIKKQKGGNDYFFRAEKKMKREKTCRIECKSGAGKLNRHPERDRTRRITSIRMELWKYEYLNYSRSVHAPKTTEGIRLAFTDLIRIAGNIPMHQLDVRMIENFLAVKKSESGVCSARKHYSLLAGAFEKARQWEMIGDNPFRKVRKPKPHERFPVFFSQCEFRCLMNSIEDPPFRELILFAVLTGMRLGEIANLTWRGIDLERKIITVQSTAVFRTKNGCSRMVPMNENLFRMMENKSGYSTDTHVFLRNGHKFSHDQVSKIFKKYVRQSGVNGLLHFHSLRHTFASWLVHQDASLFEIQKLLGHRDIRQTMIYAHLQADAMHETVNRLTFFLRGIRKK